MPPGIFGSRADLLVDLSLATFCVLPALGRRAIGLARQRRFELHRRVQLGLLLMMTGAVALLETDIRLTGGTGALATHALRTSVVGARALLFVHLVIALATWVGWVYLVACSWRSFGRVLPGGFSRVHRRLGFLVWLGQIALATTGTLLYVIAYAL
jgi:hypothetical protein